MEIVAKNYWILLDQMHHCSNWISSKINNSEELP